MLSRSGLLAFLLLLPASTLAAESVDRPACFDAAVVARVVRSTPTELPDPGGCDVCILHWPWRVDVVVEKVFVGAVHTGPKRVTAVLHVGFNPAVKHFVFFLHREASGEYLVTDFESGVVEDYHGRYILPLAAPLTSGQLYPNSWITDDYHAALKPVRYRASDAWWLRTPNDMDDVDDVDPSWARKKGRQAVALRGLFVDDLVRLTQNQVGARCATAVGR